MEVDTPDTCSDQNKQISQNCVPREYQKRIADYAKDNNCIVYLPTNSGKTFIAVLAIRHFYPKINGPFPQYKRVFFLSPTVSLVQQQFEYLSLHLSLTVEYYIGAKNVDSWSKQRWNEELENNHVLVMTPMILQQLLQNNTISVSSIALIVFDEAHWAACTIKSNETLVPSNYSYNIILKHIHDSGISDIRLIGLTASLINSVIPLKLIKKYLSYLEKTFNGPCITINSEEVYHNNITVDCWTYEPSKFSINLIKILLGQIQSLFEFYNQKCKSKSNESEELNLEDDDFTMNETKILGKLTLFSLWLQQTVDEFGVYVAQDLVTILVEIIDHQQELYKQSNPNLASLLEQVLHIYKYIYFSFDRCLGDIQNQDERIFNLLSPKLLRLLDIFKMMLNKQSGFNCIVFVKRRLFTVLLTRFLKNLVQIKPEFENLQIDYIISANAQDPLFQQNNTTQKKIINDFKNKKLNCLVATSVLEEGIDLPQCNLVIRFDTIHIFREWVQSKGRARLSDSRFILLDSEKKKSQFSRRVHEFDMLENILSSYNFNTDKSRDQLDIKQVEEEKLVTASGTVVYGNRALSLLKRYCNNVLSAPNYPLWYPSKHDTQYRVEVQLPVNCLVPNKHLGPLRSTIANARDAAFLEVLDKLNKVGEIKEDLVPKSKNETITDLLKKRIEPLYATNKYKDLFLPNAAIRSKKVKNAKKEKLNAENGGNDSPLESKQLMNENEFLTHVSLDRAIMNKSLFESFVEDQKWYLYDVCMTSEDNSFYAFDENTTKNFGFLSRFHLPIQNKCFDVASLRYLITMQTKLVKTLDLNNEQIRLLTNMHCYLNKEATPKHLRGDLVKTKQPLFITVPISNDEIDWAVVKSFLKGQFTSKQKITKGTLLIAKHTSHMYRVVDLKSGIYPNVDILKDNLTYEQYFQKQYGVKLLEPNKEMLSVMPCSILNNVRLNPQSLRRPVFKVKVVYMPLELCEVEPITFGMYNQIICMEMLYFRLQQLCVVKKLNQTIKSEVNKIHQETKSATNEHNSLSSKLIKLRDELSSNSPTDCPDILESEELIDGIYFQKMLDPNDNDIENNFTKRQNDSTNIAEIQEVPEAAQSSKNSDLTYPSFNQGEQSTTSKNKNQIRFLDLKDAKIFHHTKHNLSNEMNQRFREVLIKKDKDFDNILNILETLVREYSLMSLLPKPVTKKKNETKQVEVIVKTVTNQEINGIDFNLWCRRNIFEEEYFVDPFCLQEALTPLVAFDTINFERYEIIGDAFLKFVVCNYIFWVFQDLDECKMSLMKNLLVSNLNLFNHAKIKNLDMFIQATKTELFKNWLPSCYEFKDRDKYEAQFYQQNVRAKTVSDLVESLIGISLTHNGIFGALMFMKWLDIPVDHPDHPITQNSSISTWFPPYVPLINQPDKHESVLELYEKNALSKLEEKIDYTFNDKTILVKAMTHHGYQENSFTGSYETMEFLGDAVIDYLVTKFLYENNHSSTPGQISAIRCAIVNNAYFGVLAVRLNLFSYLLLNNMDISRELTSYIQQCKLNHPEDKLVILDFVVLNNLTTFPLEQIKYPKTLGDIFESLVGAIYLDSGKNLNAVWKFLFSQIKIELIFFSQNTPRHFINLALELAPNGKFIPKFKNEEFTSDYCMAFVIDGKEYLGVSSNKSLAKLAAARKYVYEYLKENKPSNFKELAK